MPAVELQLPYSARRCVGPARCRTAQDTSPSPAVRPGVVGYEREVVGHALLNRQQQAVVAGNAAIP